MNGENICGTSSSSGLSPMLGFRAQVPKIAYRNDMVAGCDKESESVVPHQAGSNKYASQSGQVVIGASRNQVGNLAYKSKSELVPFQSGTNIFASQSGMKDPPGIGAFRQTVIDSEGLNFTEEMIRKSGTDIPWWSSAGSKFASQKGSGGFGKARDVLYKPVGGPELAEEKSRLGEGILRLQSGTNKFASQHGMTGFGRPRNNTLNSKWKDEWIQEWQEAEQEFEESGRGRQHERDPISGALVISSESKSKSEDEAEKSKSLEDEKTVSESKDESMGVDTMEKEELSTGKDVSSIA